MGKISVNKKRDIIKLYTSTMAYVFLFAAPSSQRVLMCVGLFIALLFMGRDSNKNPSDIRHYLMAAILDMSGMYVFYHTWIPSSKVQILAAQIGCSTTLFLTIICIAIAVMGYYSALCVSLFLVSALIKCIENLGELRAKVVECKSLLLPTAVVFFVTNIVFIIHQNLHPDAYNEGFAIYQGAEWALSLGRWAIRYINLSMNNIVFPIFNLLFSYVCIFLSGIVIIEIFIIKRKIHRFFTIVFLLITPTVICQYMYIYMDMAYSLGVLLASISAYAIINRKYVVATIWLSITLGCYQSYIGFTATILFFYLIKRILEDDSDFKVIVVDAVRYFIAGISGCVLYLIVLTINFSLFRISFSDYGGASSIGLQNSISKLGPSIKEAYLSFAHFYFNGSILSIVYSLLFLAVIILICGKRISFFKKFLSILLLFVLPIVMNCVILVAPDHEISLLMQHQCVLIIPFLFTFIEEEIMPALGKINQVIIALCSVICLVYGVKGFCTQYSVNYVQKYADLYASSAITYILNSEDYEQGDRILFAGALNEYEIQKNNALYQYSSFKKNAVVGDYKYAILSSWKNYLNSRLSFDIGTVTSEEYDNIVHSEEFIHMKCYPNKNAIVKMGNIYVVKVDATPPLE